MKCAINEHIRSVEMFRIYMDSICWKVQRKEVNVVLQKRNQTNTLGMKGGDKTVHGQASFQSTFLLFEAHIGMGECKMKVCLFPDNCPSLQICHIQ